MKSEIRSLTERELRRLSRVYSCIAIFLSGTGLALVLNGMLSDEPVLQYLGLAAWVLVKAPLDNHRFLLGIISKKAEGYGW